jgi:WD40 repeat protein
MPPADVVVQLEVIEHADGVYYLSCQSPYGETNLPVRLPTPGVDLLRRLDQVETNVLRSGARIVTRGAAGRLEKPIRELGEEMCDALLQDEVRVLFEQSLFQAKQDHAQFRLLLKIRGSTLSKLPWEFLYDRRRGDYLALNLPVVRYLEVMQPQAPVSVTLPLRVLGVICRPGDREQLDVVAEQRALSDALAPLGSGQVQLQWLAGQRWEDLWRAARREPWHILHFIGHGGFDETKGEGYLEFVDDRGASRPVHATDLGRLLDSGSLRLAVLNACESARSAGSDSFASPAASLIRRGFPAALAMQYEISDPAALVFAQALYGSIAAGEPLDRAVTDARTTVQMSQPGSFEWGTPVLYLRSTSTRVFDVTNQPPAPVRSPAAGGAPPDNLRRATDLVKNWVKGPPPVEAPRPVVAPQHSDPPPTPTPTGPATPSPPQAYGLVETHRFAHAAPVRAVAFHAAGGRVCAGGDDGVALVWDLDRARVVRCCRLPGHTSGVRTLSMTADGRYLAVAYGDPVVRVWDLDTEVVAVAFRVAEGRGVWSVRFSPDGSMLLVGCGDGLAVVTDGRGVERARLLHQAEVTDGSGLVQQREVYAARFSPDGRWIATAASDGLVRLFDPGGTVVTRLPHPGPALDVAFRPDGRRIVTGAADGNARIWDSRGQVVARLNHNAEVTAVAYSADSRWLATASADGSAQLWQGDTDQSAAWALHGGPVGGVAVHLAPSGHCQLATASTDHLVRVWAASRSPGDSP